MICVIIALVLLLTWDVTKKPSIAFVLVIFVVAEIDLYLIVRPHAAHVFQRNYVYIVCLVSLIGYVEFLIILSFEWLWKYLNL